MDATQLLTAASHGDADANGRLTPVLYEELRELAHRYLPDGVPDGGPTLQPTTLVHEAYLRLIDQSTCDFNGRTHFLAASAKAMRCVLIDHIRAEGAAKRGGGWRRITLDQAAAFRRQLDVDLLALDEALEKLARLSERAAEIVELRFFAGMTVAEVAHHLKVSERTIKGDWRMARAWLRAELAEIEG